MNAKIEGTFNRCLQLDLGPCAVLKRLTDGPSDFPVLFSKRSSRTYFKRLPFLTVILLSFFVPEFLRMMQVHVEFGGGLEGLVHGSQKSVVVDFDASTIQVADVIDKVASTLIVRSPHLFSTSDPIGIKPGILVLVNDSDWELLGGLNAPIKEGDIISFISTLHGG